MSLTNLDPFAHLFTRYTSNPINYYTNFTTTSSADPHPTEKITLESMKVMLDVLKETEKSKLPMAPLLFDPEELVL